MVNETKAQYDSFARSYTSVVDLPCCQLEGELMRIALGDCTGLAVLDLGGGSGIHARHAVDAGASVVDVFDISAEMLRMGEKEEQNLGRQDRIHWYVADATQPLAKQVENGAVRPDGYDIVMVNWTFDNATALSGLRGMWENAVSLLKPGGKFLGTRLRNIRAKYMSYGKYGNRFADIETIPGGVKYKVECLTEPPFSWDTTAMDATYPVTNDIPYELGLVDFREIPAEETDVVQKSLGFWEDFLNDPFFVMVTAQKCKNGGVKMDALGERLSL
ncbi:hypothetical protein QQS21_000466 [Conoideocrella luteorostrata]|uniref:Methyltransferase type 12 domain-containing protein n=1 Tax=Conoideocrella luteorostrata TaxID=1105319 RepID=A0AAJ0G416_9HYPO|nr:hypothetical protein QQS21_000466 [Conoideocrella luteorostrata]